MFLSTDQVVRMTEESLRGFLSLAIKELYYLDYKVAPSGKSDKDAKREFLKDISPFANAAGGDLIIGAKEPADGLSVDDRLVGVSCGEDLAKSLERVAAASIDPRIPGLQVVPVVLKTRTGYSCIIAHVPPSMSRPHMVNHEGHRSFYIRHTESSVAMSTHEIRESVLTAASAEARARHFIQNRLDELRSNESSGGYPLLFLQAMPLIAPESQWDILSTELISMMSGHDRYQGYVRFSLSTNDVRPTIDGLRGRGSEGQASFETELHRNGYLSLLIRVPKDELPNSARTQAHVFYHSYQEVFRVFAEMLEHAWRITGTDVPYLIKCLCLNARGMHMRTQTTITHISLPFEKQDLVWPEHLRATGEKPMPIADAMFLELYNAFGFSKIVA